MIRQLTVSDLEQSLELSQYAFQYKLSEEELRERLATEKPEETWGFFAGDRLAAKTSILPFEVVLHGKVFAMGGIASVASWPEHRRQGMVGKLLTHSLRVMKERGQVVSYLNPFSYSFYRRYGWENFCEVKGFTLNPHQFPKYGDVTGTIVRKNKSDWPLINGLYEEYIKRYNGMLKRTGDWWLKSVFKKKLGHLAVYYDAANRPVGYMLYIIRDHMMRIPEFVALNEEGRRGLWNFAGNHDSMVQTLSLTVPADDQLSFLLKEPLKPQLDTSFMFRVVDAAALLRQLPFRSGGGAETLAICISDEYAPWNQGTFTVETGGGGKANVIRNGTPNNAQAVLSCDIQTFSAMISGFQRPKFLHRVGRLTGSYEEMERWERALPEATPFINDMF